MLYVVYKSNVESWVKQSTFVTHLLKVLEDAAEGCMF